MWDKFLAPQKWPEESQLKEKQLERQPQADRLQRLAGDEHDQSQQMAVEQLEVCDIIGEWGQYQWSVTIFALICSTLLGLTVMVGPIWTPDMEHACLGGTNFDQVISLFGEQSKSVRQCIGTNQTHECRLLIYNDKNYGKLLTNSFDLVCSRKWLRSFMSSSASTGPLLLSSVTLGLVSDRYGRLVCIRSCFLISILAAVAAILVRDYFLFSLCLMLMASAQVGIANALSTIVMEFSAPKWRFVPILQYGLGLGSGMLLIPKLNGLTMNYRLYLATLLIVQLFLLAWFIKFGAYESIGWLLSEGQINGAQIELYRACRMNNVRDGFQLAQKIAQMQLQQIRRASRVLEQRLAPYWLAQASKQQDLEEAAEELSQLSAAIRRTFFSLKSVQVNRVGPSLWTSGCAQTDKFECPATKSKIIASDNCHNFQPNSTLLYPPGPLSPTLAMNLFSCQHMMMNSPNNNNSHRLFPNDGSATTKTTATANHTGDSMIMITSNQNLIQLALDHGKTIERQKEGTWFIIRLFHGQLYTKLTLVLMLLVTILETIFFGLAGSSRKSVGTSVDEGNYILGAIFKFVACGLFVPILGFNRSRQLAIIWPTLIGALICLTLALSEHLIPAGAGKTLIEFNASQLQVNESDLVVNHYGRIADSGSHLDMELPLVWAEKQQQQQHFVDLRETIELKLIPVGELAIAVSILVVITIAMESYPNNLRQTAPPTMMMVGRIGSILATTFLINDQMMEEKDKLFALAAMGIIASILVALLMQRDTR